MEFIDTLVGFLGVASDVTGTIADFTGAYSSLFGALATIIEFITGLSNLFA